MKAPLEKLHDILPGPPPDASDSSYIAIALGISFLLTLIIVTYKLWPRYKIYRHAKKQLRKILKQNPDNCIPAINQLIKDVAYNYWPCERYAKLHTLDWLKFLDEHSSCQFLTFSKQWEAWSYSGNVLSSHDKKAVIRECNRWFNTVCRRVPLS